jgi:hypothetical protein
LFLRSKGPGKPGPYERGTGVSIPFCGTLRRAKGSGSRPERQWCIYESVGAVKRKKTKPLPRDGRAVKGARRAFIGTLESPPVLIMDLGTKRNEILLSFVP